MQDDGHSARVDGWRAFLESPQASSLAPICLAVWLHAADSLIVATMLPSIVAEVGGAAFVGWTVSLYEVGSIVAGAASALLTIRYGLRAPMCLAAILFAAGCVLSAMADGMAVVLAGRVLQGLGGGCLTALSFVAIGSMFPKRHMARALAVVSVVWGASSFIGPLIGGVFVEFATWRAGFLFFAFTAIALAAWLALRRDLGKARITEDAQSFPMRRLSLLCLAVLAIAAGGVEVQPLRTSAFVAAGALLLAAFFALDARAGENRLMPRRAVDLRAPSGAALLMIFALSLATIAITAYGPLLVTMLHGVSALTAGLIVACSSIGWSAASIFVSGAPLWADRALIFCGMLVSALSIVGFLVFVPTGPVWAIACCALLEGAGFGMAWPFILTRATRLAPASETERISGAIPTLQRLGYAVGAAYVGIVANAAGFAGPDSAEVAGDVARSIFAASLPFAAIGLLATVIFVRRDHEFT